MGVDAEGRLRVRVAAPPVDGAANESLVRLLAAVLDVPRSDVTIESGATSRVKRVRVEGGAECCAHARRGRALAAWPEPAADSGSQRLYFATRAIGSVG